MTALREASSPRRGVSIRLRLTLLYTAILALTLIAFGSILYLAQSRATYDGIRSNLERQAQEWVRRESNPPPPGEPGDSRKPGFPHDIDLPSGTLPGRWTQTRTITGTVVGRTLDLSAATLPLSDAGLRAVQAGSGHFEFGTVEDQPVLVYSLGYSGWTGQDGIVQVAFPVAQPQQSLNALRLLLIAGSMLAILVAFLLGWMFAGTALDPIHRITQTARTIGVGARLQPAGSLRWAGGRGRAACGHFQRHAGGAGIDLSSAGGVAGIAATLRGGRVA